MIYLAKIKVEIKKSSKRKEVKKNKYYRDKIIKYSYEKQVIELESIYRQDAELEPHSYFISSLERKLNLRKSKGEEYKIISIEKIKPLGLNKST